LPVAPFTAAAVVLLMPMAGVVTQQVRPGHPAIDIACLPGTPVRAAHSGHGSTHWDHNLGWTFSLSDGRGLQTLYAHLQNGAPAGAYLRGDVIGRCGNTGRLSTGPHLHFGSNQPDRLSLLASPLPLEEPTAMVAAPVASQPAGMPTGPDLIRTSAF
jgi:murein DD-endopeptidase MepM/ murein hydrolase activator NlpD